VTLSLKDLKELLAVPELSRPVQSGRPARHHGRQELRFRYRTPYPVLHAPRSRGPVTGKTQLANEDALAANKDALAAARQR